ncbi:hypothetical protein F4860DRAFT_53540 [Xylaria cubensis]|nr:hypothetical protein F4860DRAFT_53540 [Xylaria cubensis]
MLMLRRYLFSSLANGRSPGCSHDEIMRWKNVPTAITNHFAACLYAFPLPLPKNPTRPPFRISEKTHTSKADNRTPHPHAPQTFLRYRTTRRLYTCPLGLPYCILQYSTDLPIPPSIRLQEVKRQLSGWTIHYKVYTYILGTFCIHWVPYCLTLNFQVLFFAKHYCTYYNRYILNLNNQQHYYTFYSTSYCYHLRIQPTYVDIPGFI